MTSRLERYRPQTEAWLAANGIRYRNLVMHPAAPAAERRAAHDHAARKAAAYRKSDAWLFIESEPGQTEEIVRLTGRPVYCVETHTMRQPGDRAARAAGLERRARVVGGRWKQRVRGTAARLTR